MIEMISVDKRIELLDKLGQYMLSDNEAWQQAKELAERSNSWFTTQHIDIAVNNIATEMLQKDKLQAWLQHYTLPERPVLVGIVMAGNIPLVGFHDFLCGFMSGHNLLLKLSSKDEVLIKHLINKLAEWEPAVKQQVQASDLLKGCDAYIATGSNNTARYFEQYFGKYPHIIRRNRTSVALLQGGETAEELRRLADDVFLYYGLGCRNITQVAVPKGYDFTQLLDAMTTYADYMHHHKYKNNYDYHLALYLLNKVLYMTNENVLMTENELPFSPVSVLHYRYYDDKKQIQHELQNSKDIQCIVGRDNLPFGEAQKPSLMDYADGVDTMRFLCGL